MATNTVTKPTTIPVWARTTSNIVEPASGKKDSGWILGGVHSSAEENWLAKSTGDWCNWLNERLADGSTLDILKVTSQLLVDASGVAATNAIAVEATGKGTGEAFKGTGGVDGSGNGQRAAAFLGGSAVTSGMGGEGVSISGGVAAGNSNGGTAGSIIGGTGAGTGNGGVGLSVQGGLAGGTGDQGVAIHGFSILNDGNHGIKAQSKATAPKYSALRIVPQNADPTSGSEGDLFTTSSSHADGAGHLKKYHGGAFRHVGVQAYARITVTAGVGVTLDKNIGVSSISLQSGNTEIRINFDEDFSDTDYVAAGSNLQGQPMFVTAENQNVSYCDVSVYSLTTSAKIDLSSTSTQFSVEFCGD